MMSGLNHLLKLNSYSICKNHEENTLHILMKWDGGIQWAFKEYYVPSICMLSKKSVYNTMYKYIVHVFSKCKNNMCLCIMHGSQESSEIFKMSQPEPLH